MVPTPLVGASIDEGRALVEKLVEQGVQITGAYWLYNLEQAYPRLHIVSPLVDEAGPSALFPHIHKALSALGDSSLLVSDTSVRGTHDPLAQAIRSYIKRGDRSRELRVSGVYLSNLLIDDMYVYWFD